MSDNTDGGFFTTVVVSTVPQHLVLSLNLGFARLEDGSPIKDSSVDEPCLRATAYHNPKTAMPHVH